jgi:plastocyanin
MCCSHMSKQPFKWEVLRELRRNPLRASGRVVPRDGIDPAWLYVVSATLQVQTQIKALACGSVVDALYEADLVALTLLVAAGVLAAGCGGTKSGSGGYGGGSPATTATPSATGSGGRGAYGGGPTTSGAGTPAGGTAVAIDNFAFSPATLKAKAGQQVTWTNKQGVAHTVTANAGAFNHPMPSGATFSFTFTKAGTFAYHCTIHPSMHGTVVVS